MNFKKPIIVSIIFIVCIIISFFTGRNIRIKQLSKSHDEMEQSLKIATDKMNEIIQRNDEVERLLNESQNYAILLEKDNCKILEKLNDIDDVYNSMKKEINRVTTTTESSLDRLMKLQDNQIIIEKYIKEMNTLLEE